MKGSRWLQRPLLWFATLEEREQWVVGGGATLLLGVLGVMLLLLPGLEWLESQARLVEEKGKLVTWMEQSALEVKRLQAAGVRASPVVSGESLLALADRSAKEKGLGGVLQRVEPEGSGRVRLWFEKAPFVGLMGWLSDLAAQYGVQVENVTMDREEMAGLVRARLVLSLPDRGSHRGLEK